MPAPSTVSCLLEPSILPQKLQEHPGEHSVSYPSNYGSCPTCNKPLHLIASEPCDGVWILYSAFEMKADRVPLCPAMSPGALIPACAFRGTQLPSPQPREVAQDCHTSLS